MEDGEGVGWIVKPDWDGLSAAGLVKHPRRTRSAVDASSIIDQFDELITAERAVQLTMSVDVRVPGDDGFRFLALREFATDEESLVHNFVLEWSKEADVKQRRRCSTAATESADGGLPAQGGLNDECWKVRLTPMKDDAEQLCWFLGFDLKYTTGDDEHYASTEQVLDALATGQYDIDHCECASSDDESSEDDGEEEDDE
eukprot:6024751-Prymnesium_polylepis.2